MKKLTILSMLFASVILLTACQEEAKSLSKQRVRPVKLHTVEEPQTAMIKRFPGTVVASQAAALSFRIPGQLVELKGLEGKAVVKGEVLARLDDRDARNQLAEREAAFELAQSEEMRSKRLLERGLVSRASYDTVLTNLTSTTSALALARDNREYTILKAPFDGIISSTSVNNHQFVQARDAVLSIENQDFIDISFEMPEQLIINVVDGNSPNNGYQPEITFPSLPEQTFRASYKESSLEPSPGSQTYTVVVTMPRPEGVRLLQGMIAQLSVDFTQIAINVPDNQAITVPLTSIAYPDDLQGSDAFIWRYDPESGAVSPVQVTLAELSDTGVEVLTGIKAGDQIVTAGTRHLKDGQTVKPWQREQGL